MKNLIYILIAFIFLSACSSMPALKVHKSGPLGRQEINGGLYYNDPQGQGHNSEVIHKVIDKNTAQIIIPAQYRLIQNTDLSKTQKDKINKFIAPYNLDDTAVCSIDNCKLTQDKLIIETSYDRFNFAGSDIYLPIEFLNPFTKLNKSSTVNIDLYIQPAKIFLICGNKICEVLDELGENVNSIYIRKTITVKK